MIYVIKQEMTFIKTLSLDHYDISH